MSHPAPDAAHPAPDAAHPAPDAAHPAPAGGPGFWSKHWGKVAMGVLTTGLVGGLYHEYDRAEKGASFLQAVNAPDKLSENTRLIPSITLAGKLKVNSSDPGKPIFLETM